MTVLPTVAVGAIVVRDDSLLLIRRGRGTAVGKWAPPGGRIEWGETAAEAVVRELAEETGLSGVCGPLLGHAESIGDEHHHVILDFSVTLLDDDDPVPGDDADEVAWVPLADVADWAIVDGLAEFLHDHGVIATIC